MRRPPRQSTAIKARTEYQCPRVRARTVASASAPSCPPMSRYAESRPSDSSGCARPAPLAHLTQASLEGKRLLPLLITLAWTAPLGITAAFEFPGPVSPSLGLTVPPLTQCP